MARATSSGAPSRPRAIFAASSGLAWKPPPAIAPGAMAFTRIPEGPRARASSFITIVSPALLAL